MSRPAMLSNSRYDRPAGSEMAASSWVSITANLSAGTTKEPVTRSTRSPKNKRTCLGNKAHLSRDTYHPRPARTA